MVKSNKVSNKASIVSASTRPEIGIIIGNIKQVMPSLSRLMSSSSPNISMTNWFQICPWICCGSPSPGESITSRSFSYTDSIIFVSEVKDCPSLNILSYFSGGLPLFLRRLTILLAKVDFPAPIFPIRKRFFFLKFVAGSYLT